MCKNSPIISLQDLLLNNPNSIDIRDCYVKTGIENILQDLDKELVGLKAVKTRVREISSVLLFDRIRELQELGSLNASLHMSFTGRSGTGKTTVATKIALVLRNLGFLTKGHITNVTREDLVGQYVGHTAPKTREQLKLAQGGILFIDEAHHLYKPDNERDYGAESVELLLQVMENQRDDLILIFSGQKEKIETFYNCNPGVSSRIGNHVNFEDYNSDELLDITQFLLTNESRYKFSEETLPIFAHYIKQLITYPTFANVRTMKIFLNQLFAYQAIRIEESLSSKGNLSYESLVKILPEDFKYFTPEDFINIIGSENVTLFGKNPVSSTRTMPTISKAISASPQKVSVPTPTKRKLY